MKNELVLRALDGSNPLAFMAALGTQRLLSLELQTEMQMAWERKDGAWRPKLRPFALNEEEISGLLAASNWWAPVEEIIQLLGGSVNLTVSKGVFRPLVESGCEKAGPQDRRLADFAAAFGSEACAEEKNDRIERTDFCFITGSGHQDFLGTILELGQCVTHEHIYDALFGEWKTEKKGSMRWDPQDAAEYALQWDDPGPKGARAVWGANRLAFEALPCFPTAPVVSKGRQRIALETTGFSWRDRKDEFTWPIWEGFIGPATVKSLMARAELQEKGPDRELLRAIGIPEVYRAERVRIGQGANFKVSFRPARSI